MIRKSEKQDTDKLLKIWLEASVQAHHFVEATYWKNMVPSVKKYYLPNTDTFVFEDKHQLKGFLSIIDDKYIGALFIDPRFQNKKIGTKLVDYAKRIYPELSLKVFTKNEKALRFYQKHGFKIISEQKDESTKENELLMSWAMANKTGFYKRCPGDS